MPRVDRLGRPVKDPFRLMQGIGAVNWIAERVPPVIVPGEYWSLDVKEVGKRIDDSGKSVPVTEPVAIMACPCGEVPIIPLLEGVFPCACERYFAFDGIDVYAFNPPQREPAAA